MAELEDDVLLGTRCAGDTRLCGHDSPHVHGEECDMSCACWTDDAREIWFEADEGTS